MKIPRRKRPVAPVVDSKFPASEERKKIITTGGYARERSADLYHTYRWTKESRAFKESHPLCAECRRHGRISPAEVTDHIIPYPICDYWDQSNWQPLCRKCNDEKGQRDKRLIEAWRRKHLQGGGG